MNKRGLGKGLAALIEIPEEMDAPKEGVLEIDVNLIDANHEQPRKNFDEEKLNELAHSIKTHGVIQPLIVRQEGGRYRIIAGERRYRAARIAGLSKVPVVLREASERELLQMSIVENVQREDLNPIEEAEAIAMLIDRFSLRQEEAADILGKSRSAVANALRLLTLPAEISEMVIAGSLSAGHARTLLFLKDKKLMLYAAEHIAESGLSVRETENYVKKIGGAVRKKPRKPVARPPEFSEAERTLAELLDTKVRLVGNERCGKIVIEYFTKEQLFSLYELFLRIKS